MKGIFLWQRNWPWKNTLQISKKILLFQRRLPELCNDVGGGGSLSFIFFFYGLFMFISFFFLSMNKLEQPNTFAFCSHALFESLVLIPRILFLNIVNKIMVQTRGLFISITNSISNLFYGKIFERVMYSSSNLYYSQNSFNEIFFIYI